MDLIDELLPGCFLLKPKKFIDQRGCFVKTFHKDQFNEYGFDMEIREEFFSVSHKNVLRGMHFQLPPHGHDKLVYCTRGSVLDVLLDLRAGERYGQVASTKLTSENGHIIYIPRGLAHGFLALEDDTLMLYKTSTVHTPEYDSGIHWDSFGFDWGLNKPNLSLRDEKHIAFGKFDSPF